MAEFRVADLVKGTVVEMSASLATSAALLSTEFRLPMADSFILATAREDDARTKDERTCPELSILSDV